MSESKDDLARVVMTVPEAGRLLGLGRDKAYEAARNGQIPILRFGKKKVVVPTAPLRRMLGLEPESAKAPPAAAETIGIHNARPEGDDVA